METTQETTQEVTTEVTTETTPESKEGNTFDFEAAFDKFENALTSRLQRQQESLEKNIAKSIAEKLGGTEKEAEKIVETFKAKKEETPDYQKMIEELTAETNTYKEQLYNVEFEHSFNQIYNELGFNEEKMDYVKRLADLSNVKTEDGKVDAEKLKESLIKVAEDFADLLKENPKKNFNIKVNSGTKNAGEEKEEAYKEILKKIM